MFTIITFILRVNMHYHNIHVLIPNKYIKNTVNCSFNVAVKNIYMNKNKKLNNILQKRIHWYTLSPILSQHIPQIHNIKYSTACVPLPIYSEFTQISAGVIIDDQKFINHRLQEYT